MGGAYSDFLGNTKLYLDHIQNPLTEVTSKSIDVKIYDGLNKKIIDRSYFNLNYNRFKYTYPGPVINMNNNAAI
jgi:hypothetical protein